MQDDQKAISEEVTLGQRAGCREGMIVFPQQRAPPVECAWQA